ncbi:hypothetical protein [Burkholderia cenocepacia]
MSKQFKAGDRMRITYDGLYPSSRWGKGKEVQAVDAQPGDKYVRVKAHDGCIGLIRADRMEKVEPVLVAGEPHVETAFKVGDTVRLKDQSKFGGGWGGPMGVQKVNNFGTVFAYNATAFGGTLGGFNPDDLEHVPQAATYKVSATVQTARGAVSRQMPETYPSIEAAREAIIKRGKRGVLYEIFPYTVAETVRLVETTTRTLEAA